MLTYYLVFITISALLKASSRDVTSLPIGPPDDGAICSTVLSYSVPEVLGEGSSAATDAKVKLSTNIHIYHPGSTVKGKWRID